MKPLQPILCPGFALEEKNHDGHLKIDFARKETLI
jgi:hypothetical protein